MRDWIKLRGTTGSYIILKMFTQLQSEFPMSSVRLHKIHSSVFAGMGWIFKSSNILHIQTYRESKRKEAKLLKLRVDFKNIFSLDAQKEYLLC